MSPTPYKRRTPYYRPGDVSPQMTRRVWAVVSHEPAISVRGIAAELHIAYATALRALCRLEDTGYITIVHGKSRARRVLVPLIEDK